jgi:O-antigen ligase
LRPDLALPSSPLDHGGVRLALAAGFAIVVGATASVAPLVPLALCGVLAAGLVVIWLTPRLGLAMAILLPASMAGLFVPRSAATLVQGLVLLYAAFLVAAAFQRRSRAAPAALAALGVLAVWLLFALNPNTPSLSVAVAGARKVGFVYVALALGLLWAHGRTVSVERTLARILLVIGGAALLLHLGAPGVESGFARSAGEFTEEFAGQKRMTGFYGGPFHISLLGAFLVLWGWHSFLSKAESGRVAAAFALIGVALLYFAEVRTGYLAVALGVLLTLLLRPSPGRTRGQSAALTVLVAIVVAFLLASGTISSEAISSLGHLGSDSRVESRVETFGAAFDLIRHSPLVGWGPGSAGSGVSQYFFLHQHVTSHNMLVGILVEGGIVGLAVAALPFVLFARLSRGLRSVSHPAAAAAIALLAFAFSTDVFEALPVSFALILLIGLRGREDPDPVPS